jgi:thiol-disulfide isomerase/thioredoxin
VAALAREGHLRPGTETWERHAELLGRPAPKLKLDTWMNGKVRPEDMKGKIVVIDFWATWCRPCIDAIPHNIKMAKKYADRGVMLIGVCGGGRGEEYMGRVVKRMGVTYPVCHPGFGTVDAWRVEYWPTYGVIDRNGILRALGVGRDYVEPIIDALLEEEGPAPAAGAAGAAGGAADRADKAARGGEVMRLAPEGHELPDVLESRHAELLNGPAPALQLHGWAGAAPTAEDMNGKIVVVDFWATWCPDCIKAVPLNNELATRYAKDVVFIGACGSGRGEEKMRQVAGETGMAYPTALTTKATTDAWRLAFWPTYGIIDRQGSLRALGVKPEYVGRIIEAILAAE